jgi:UDP-N-acetylmuramate dehydrogenase
LKSEIRARLAAGMHGAVRCDEQLARHTSLRVGGPADLFLVPADLADLQRALAILKEARLPWLVLGGGYNLLVRDGGFRGAVISLKDFATLEALPGARVNAGAGVASSSLVRFAGTEGWSGLEFLAGIPGSVGGAVSMNAGAHGAAVLDRLETLTTLLDGAVTTRPREQLAYGYRYLELAPGEIIIAACFSLTVGDHGEIARRVEEFLAHRRSVQQVGYPNAGSFFKNPEGNQAWRLIDKAGLRGYRVGGAQISEVHSNFLVNREGATAKDFLELARQVKEKVAALSGIELVEEVRIVGVD